MKILDRYPLFLFLLPAFILLHIEKDYGELLNYPATIKEILIICIVPFVLSGFAWLLYRSAPKANLFAFISIFLFYFLGDIKDALMKAFPHTFIQRYYFLIPAALLFIIVCGWVIKKTNKNYYRLFRFIHLALFLFILVDAVGMITSSGKKEKSQSETLAGFVPCKDCPTPDIYYVILDEYTSSAYLQSGFGFDNSAIDSFLTSRGFQLIPHSKSNYNLTAFSMSSIFSLNYLTTIDTSDAYFLKKYLPGIKIMYESPLFSLMEKQGYRVYNQSIFHVAGHPSSIPLDDTWRTKMLYQQYNILKKMDNEIGWQFPSWMKIRIGRDKANARDQHDYLAEQQLYAALREKSSQPKFVYTHFRIPHDFPFLDSAGNRIPPLGFKSLDAMKKSYLQQVVNANKTIRRIVDSIQQSSRTPPIIIIQGDHGFRSDDYSFKNEEFHNFNAFYFPDKSLPPLPDSLTSVNTFRIVFNRLFKANYPMLGNKHFFLKYKPL